MTNGKVILHLDFNAFYCAVEEHEDPSLKGIPFIVKQKDCIATLSYAARDLGLKKLSSVRRALELHPSLKVVDGESLEKYRAAGKMLFHKIKSLVGEETPVERLGLEEMWIDLTEMVDSNLDTFRESNILSFLGGEVPDDALDVELKVGPNSVFCPDFLFGIPGQLLPVTHGVDAPAFYSLDPGAGESPDVRIYVGVHIASYLQQKLLKEEEYSCSMGVANSKMLSKVVGNENKPNGLTSILPSYNREYLGPKPLRALPWFGSRIIQDLQRDIASARSVKAENYSSSTLSELSMTDLSVSQILDHFTEESFVRSIGKKGNGCLLWQKLVGIDNDCIKDYHLPRQVSIEDTFSKPFISFGHLLEVFGKLSLSLLRQISQDLVEDGEWLAKPQNMRIQMIYRESGGLYAGRYSSSQRKSKTISFKPYFYDFPRICSFPPSLKEFHEQFVNDCSKSVKEAAGKYFFNVRMLNVCIVFETPHHQ